MVYANDICIFYQVNCILILADVEPGLRFTLLSLESNPKRFEGCGGGGGPCIFLVILLYEFN